MVPSFISRTASLGRMALGGHLGWLRGALGAGLGIALSGAVTWMLLGANVQALPWLVAPLGASAVLVFAVPASPLAQPWPVIGGGLISALVGLGMGHLAGGQGAGMLLGPGLAVGVAIAAMALTRSLHPPGGALALLCALGAAGPQSWGLAVMAPVLANLLVLAATGWLYNNLTGHAWPHRAVGIAQPSPQSQYTSADLEAVLAEWDEMLDVDSADLDALFRAVERRVARRTGR